MQHLLDRVTTLLMETLSFSSFKICHNFVDFRVFV